MIMTEAQADGFFTALRTIAFFALGAAFFAVPMVTEMMDTKDAAKEACWESGLEYHDHTKEMVWCQGDGLKAAFPYEVRQ